MIIAARSASASLSHGWQALRDAEARLDPGLRRDDVEVGLIARQETAVTPAKAGVQMRLPDGTSPGLGEGLIARGKQGAEAAP